VEGVPDKRAGALLSDSQTEDIVEVDKVPWKVTGWEKSSMAL
jgi:hypothetical protein